jgi:sulfotransferase family protein
MLKPSRSLSIARPNFFVLGAPKCGTTTLHEVLMAHPHIFMTKQKEPQFFDTDTYYNRGLDRYLRDHFRGAAGFKARGEASPTYLRSGKARDRIRGDLGKDLRFVVILRDPVKRAWSAYLQECRRGLETETFERALELEPTRLSRDPTCAAYFLGGLYARQLRVWFEAFPREHFLVLLTEDLAERPAAVARQAFAFLEVDPDVEFSPPSPANVGWTPRCPRLGAALNRRLKRFVPYSSRQRVGKLINRWISRPFEGAPTIDPAIARALRRRYYDEILAVEEIIGRDLGMWRSDD